MDSFTRRRLSEFEEDLAKTPKSLEDEAILSIAAELCKRVGVQDKPIYMDWVVSRDRGGAGFSLSFMAADNISWGPTWLTLPKRLKGLLSPEEWRPLLASSLIYNYQLRQRLAYEEMKKAGTPGLLIGFPFYLYVGLPGILSAFASNSLSQMGMWSVIFFSPVVLVSLLGSRVEKSMRLRADREAVDLVGKESLLSSLRKIQAMKFKELERWRPDVPRLSQRLSNIIRHSVANSRSRHKAQHEPSQIRKDSPLPAEQVLHAQPPALMLEA